MCIQAISIQVGIVDHPVSLTLHAGMACPSWCTEMPNIGTGQTHIREGKSGFDVLTLSSETSCNLTLTPVRGYPVVPKWPTSQAILKRKQIHQPLEPEVV
jgi:hypothetical protein